MHKIKGSLVAIFVGLSTIAAPAYACWTNVEQDAARIANMNQMLMVSALRCRFGNHNFLDNYNRFIRNNNALLASQHNIIKARYARNVGEKAAFAELDKFVIGLSNYYGGGHGDPDCSKLEKLTDDLSQGRNGVSELADLADELVGVPRQASSACPVSIAARR